MQQIKVVFLTFSANLKMSTKLDSSFIAHASDAIDLECKLERDEKISIKMILSYA